MSLKNPWKFHCNPFTGFRGAVDMWCQVPFHNKYNSSSLFENPKIKRVQNGISCKTIHSLVLRVLNMACLLHIAEIPVVRSTIKYEYPIPWMGPNNCWKVSRSSRYSKNYSFPLSLMLNKCLLVVATLASGSRHIYLVGHMRNIPNMLSTSLFSYSLVLHG